MAEAHVIDALRDKRSELAGRRRKRAYGINEAVVLGPLRPESAPGGAEAEASEVNPSATRGAAFDLLGE